MWSSSGQKNCVFPKRKLPAWYRSSTEATTGPAKPGTEGRSPLTERTNSVTRRRAMQSSRLYARSIRLVASSLLVSHDSRQARLCTPEALGDDHLAPRKVPTSFRPLDQVGK